MSRRVFAAHIVLVALFAGPAQAQIGEPTGDVMLRFEGFDDPDPALLERLAQEPGVLAFERRAGKWPTFLVRVERTADPFAVSGALQRRPEVKWAEPNRWVNHIPQGGALDDFFWPDLWHLENTGLFEGALPGADIHAVPAWELTNGEGQVVAVIDGGIDSDHPDLNVVHQIDVIDNDLDANPEEGQNNPGHGTAVAGVSVAVGNNGIGVAGVAWGAGLMAVRLLGGATTLAETRDAFILATDAGASVLNNSWTFLQGDCEPVPFVETLHEATEYPRLEGRGGLGTSVVFSHGNQGCEYSEYPLLAGEGVLTVGSLTDQDRKFGYSSWGPLLDVMSPSGPVGNGARPGLWSTDIVGDVGFNGRGDDNEYTHRMGGTSGAAPIVAGVIALMYSVNDRLTVADVNRVLCETAVRIDPGGAGYDATGRSDLYGCGRVDASAAVFAVANGAPGAPLWQAPEPGGPAYLDEVVLAWESGGDPDGEALTWDLVLVPEQVEGDDDDSADDGILYLDGLTDQRADLTGQLSVGEWTATVTPVDSWGAGEPSEPLTFEVAERPEPPTPEPADDEDGGSGCAASVGSTAPSGLTGLLLLALLRGLRRRSP